MTRALLFLCAIPALLRAQDVVIDGGSNRQSALILHEIANKPHLVRTGSGRIDFPRDSTVTTSLIVIGRPTYLSSRVEGDVVVIGADLFLRPGSSVTGRAVAIGGTVVSTMLGSVAGGTDSYHDETYVATQRTDGVTLTYERLSELTEIPVFQFAGLEGLLLPTYDRVDGLTIPMGVLVTADRFEIEPRLSYRSRIGVVDPLVELKYQPDLAIHFEGEVGRRTRSNEMWNYSDLINSLITVFAGSDTRNYFRSTGGEARMFDRLVRPGYTVEPFIGGRYENVSPISATGDVFTFIGKRDTLRIARPNPSVEPATIGSALFGATLFDTAGVVLSRFRAEVERSVVRDADRPNFTQLTLDGRVEFPTFGPQSLHFRGHAVATMGDSVPRARYAYLGGSGTIPEVPQLTLGGTDLVFVESVYAIPLDAFYMRLIGSPILSLRDWIGTAGIGSLPTLEHEIGGGIGFTILHIDLSTDVARKRGTKVALSLSF